jgi:hypothetical protein
MAMVVTMLSLYDDAAHRRRGATDLPGSAGALKTDGDGHWMGMSGLAIASSCDVRLSSVATAVQTSIGGVL